MTGRKPLKWLRRPAPTVGRSGMGEGIMDRREFLQAAGAGVALSSLGGRATWAFDGKPRRVGLIGTGWYGKVDVLRLIQVAPVEVVSLCDVDSKMLAEAAEI